MALNISFDGFAFDKDSILGNANIYYQALFYPSTTASSPSKWNDVRLVEASGYYSCNLGDNNFLGQEGTVLTGAIVILVFWKGGIDRIADCGVLTEWGAVELILDGSTFYTNDVQTKANIAPNLIWSDNIPTHSYVNTIYTITNNSTDTHLWNFEGILSSGSVTMYHWYTRYSQVINSVNRIEFTDYNWGDTATSTGLTGTTNGTHSFSAAGTYTIDIEVFDYCGGSASDSVTVDIYWNAPSPNVTRCNSGGTTQGNTIITPDTPVYFKYNGSDVDNTITSIEWIIIDTGSYGSTTTIITAGKDDIVVHANGLGTSWEDHPATPNAFTNPGTHTVEVIVNWYDGHSNQTITYSENFTQNRFNSPPVANLVCNEAISNIVSTPSTVVSFNYIGTNPDSRIIGIDWTINDDTNTVISDVLPSNTVYHSNGEGASWYGNLTTSGAFTNPDGHLIELKVYWNDGWDDNEVNYSETITQGRFTGPTVSFSQNPDQATVGSGISFINTSTDVDMVGLGLPNHEEYKWVWYDESSEEVETDKPYSYIFNKISNSVECSVKLCAEWSDGFDSHITCVTEDVVFGTIVTITPENCFYNLDIIGTSSDGTISAYSWVVSSGISNTGPWTEIWSSPVGMDQKEKPICFSSVGWYKIEGFIYGSGAITSDHDTLFVDTVCEGGECDILNIWNGTGVLDAGSDWVHSGVGVESSIAMYQGTNGMLIGNSLNEDELIFHTTGYFDVNINDYDFLSFWINMKELESGKDIELRLYSTNDSTNGDVLYLSNYIILDRLNEWQRPMIFLDRFNITYNDEESQPTYVNKLVFTLQGKTDFWIDNINLITGGLLTIAVCSPDAGANTFTETLVPPVADLRYVGKPNIRGRKEKDKISPPNMDFGVLATPYPRPINL